MTCPACGEDGDGDRVLANNQKWCGNGDCMVVSYTDDGASV